MKDGRADAAGANVKRRSPAAFLISGRDYMRPNQTDITWSGKRRRAVELVAQDLRSDVEIEACGSRNRTPFKSLISCKRSF